MNYLFYEKESEERAKVVLIYHVEPPQNLLNSRDYITVDEVQEPEQKEGKSPLLYCNPQTGDVWYEYVDRPLTPEETLNKKLEEQQSQIEELTLLLGDMVLGGNA